MSNLEATARSAARTKLLRTTTPQKNRYYIKKAAVSSTQKRSILRPRRNLEELLLAELRRLAASNGGRTTVMISGKLFSLNITPQQETGTSVAGGDIDGDDVATIERRLLARGRRDQLEILLSDEMLTLEQAHGLSGIPVRTLSQMRADGRLLALARPGAMKGFRFPRWQFDDTVLKIMPVVLSEFGLSRTWQAYDFLTRPEPLLGGRIPLDEICNGGEALVVRILKAASRLEQGSY